MMKDLSGLRVGRLTVLNFSHKRNKSYYWNCICECGSTCTVHASSLSKATTKSCGCLKNEIREHGASMSGSWKGVGDLSGSWFCNLKSQAKFCKRDFDLDLDYLWNLFLEQNKCCALSGLPIVIVAKYVDSISNKGSASLDRIDSQKGYIKGNVQWVHREINFMKQDLNQDRFISLCKLVAENQKDNIFNFEDCSKMVPKRRWKEKTK